MKNPDNFVAIVAGVAGAIVLVMLLAEGLGWIDHPPVDHRPRLTRTQ